MNKIRVIDLLNKIANGEEVPKKVQWGVHNYTFCGNEYKALDELGKPLLIEQAGHYLNDEVEIIEENKKIEKIDMFDYFTGYDFDNTSIDLRKHLEVNFQILNDKINEIIDYLEENK